MEKPECYQPNTIGTKKLLPDPPADLTGITKALAGASRQITGVKKLLSSADEKAAGGDFPLSCDEIPLSFDVFSFGVR
jgi:hypothetical protein